MKIKIAGLNYDLKIVDEYNENLKLDGFYRAGITNKREETIYLSNDLNSEMFKKVLLHELTHAFVYASGMGQIEWKEENVADFIESHLLQIYEIYKKILKKLKI